MHFIVVWLYIEQENNILNSFKNRLWEKHGNMPTYLKMYDKCIQKYLKSVTEV